jgi:hypothetical protein
MSESNHLRPDRTQDLAAVWSAVILRDSQPTRHVEIGATSMTGGLHQLARDSCEGNGGHLVVRADGRLLAIFNSIDTALQAAIAVRDSLVHSDQPRGNA